MKKMSAAKIADGSLMNCYGTRTIKMKLSDKCFSTPAIIIDVENEQPFEHLIGKDFIQTNQLSLEWFEGDLLYISDKQGLFHRLEMRKPHPSARQGMIYAYTEVDASAPQELDGTAPPQKK